MGVGLGLAGAEAREGLGRKLTWASWVLTGLVWGLVIAMREIRLPLPDGVSLSYLPGFHASLNSLAACLLIGALVAIRGGKISWHVRFISAAMFCSGIFLLSYVCYHLTSEPTSYGGEGIWRQVYYLLLISHIVLAAAGLPLILQAWIYGFTSQYERHRRVVRWAYPLWLYVAVTGPLCYLMLRPFY
jgi:putative membrane protein